MDQLVSLKPAPAAAPGRSMAGDRSATRVATSDSWQRMLAQYETIDLERISDTAFTDRIDTKYVLRHEDLFAALDALAGDYSALDIDGSRFTSYRTHYFDTDSFALFRRHHAAGGRRYKVRSRVYENTGLSFIEVKSKLKNGATAKVRQKTAELLMTLDADAAAFVDTHFPLGTENLQPALLNGFDRISLLSNRRRERLTVDLDIEVHAGADRIRLPGVAVAELKQERRGGNLRDSEFLRTMRAMNIRPTGFSKYCICLLMTRRDLKHNRFKPLMRRLERLMGEPHAVG